VGGGGVGCGAEGGGEDELGWSEMFQELQEVWSLVMEVCHDTHTATHCNTLQHTATHCNTEMKRCACSLWRCVMTHTHCNALQHTATHCNTLQHRDEEACLLVMEVCHETHTAMHCNTLQHTATHCTTGMQRGNRGNITFD